MEMFGSHLVAIDIFNAYKIWSFKDLPHKVLSPPAPRNQQVTLIWTTLLQQQRCRFYFGRNSVASRDKVIERALNFNRLKCKVLHLSALVLAAAHDQDLAHRGKPPSDVPWLHCTSCCACSWGTRHASLSRPVLTSTVWCQDRP